MCRDECRIYDCVYVHHEVLVFLKPLVELLLCHLLELFSFRIGDEIPYFRSTFMHIIHGEKIEIFKVPAKGAKEHTRVGPRPSHTRNLLPDILK